MMKHVCSTVVVLAAVLVIAVPAGAADLSFTFENPPYTEGVAHGQDGWYEEAGVSNATISASGALAGSQSLLFQSGSSAPGSPSVQRIWHGTAAQRFTGVTTLEFLVQASLGNHEMLLQSGDGRGYYRCKAVVEAESWTIGYGFDAGTLISYAPSVFVANDLYKVIVTLDFVNQQHRTVVSNLTDGVQEVDTGLLAMNAGTTTANAATDALYHGMRLTGNWQYSGSSEGRIDNIQFNPPATLPPGSTSFTFEDPPYTEGVAHGQDGWYEEAGESIPVVSNSAPLTGSALAGSQSLVFISNSGAPASQRIWHGLGAHVFTTITTVEFLIQTAQGQLGILLADATGQGYYRCTVDSEFENWTIGYGADAATFAVYAGGSEAFKPNKLHKVSVTLDFKNHTHRTIATNLTDSLAVLDTGLLAMNPTTTRANAATDNLYTGMRLIGAHNWISTSEGVIDNIAIVSIAAGSMVFIH